MLPAGLRRPARGGGHGFGRRPGLVDVGQHSRLDRLGVSDALKARRQVPATFDAVVQVLGLLGVGLHGRR